MTSNKGNSILALRIVSESELAKVLPDFSCELEIKHPVAFKAILHSMGIDTTRVIERQDGLKHRNMLNEIVICSRYVGYERIDDEWIKSGYASQAARDKASGSRLLEDLYRAKGLTEDAQAKQMSRDVYSVIDESVQE